MRDHQALPGSGDDGRLRLGVIGAGTWAVAAHIPGLLRRPEVEPWIVSRRDEALLEEIRARFGFARATTDWHDVIDARPDIIALTGPVHLRAEQALAAIDAGIHILAEKPFTIDPADAWDLVQTGERLGRHIVVSFGWNYRPMVREMKRLMV
jgi:predicted dehydrogenase